MFHGLVSSLVTARSESVSKSRLDSGLGSVLRPQGAALAGKNTSSEQLTTKYGRH